MNNGYSQIRIPKSANLNISGDQSISDDYRSGAWACAEALMNWLNTLESLSIPKTEIYEWAMKYRPKAKSAPSALEFPLAYDYTPLEPTERTDNIK